MFLYSKQIYESHLSKENMTQPSSMFIDGKIIEMPSVKFFLKHPVGLNPFPDPVSHFLAPWRPFWILQGVLSFS